MPECTIGFMSLEAALSRLEGTCRIGLAFSSCYGLALKGCIVQRLQLFN